MGKNNKANRAKRKKTGRTGNNYGFLSGLGSKKARSENVPLTITDLEFFFLNPQETSIKLAGDELTYEEKIHKFAQVFPNEIITTEHNSKMPHGLNTGAFNNFIQRKIKNNEITPTEISELEQKIGMPLEKAYTNFISTSFNR